MTVIETHLSRVHLRGDRAYKLLLPVRYPFIDLSTAEKRERECRREVAHNAPWAPGVYLGVVPLTAGADPFDGVGEVEHAVLMQRLPADRAFDRLAATATVETITRIGHFIHEVHRTLPRRPAATQPPVVAQRILDNLAELAARHELPEPLIDRAKAAVASALEAAGPALERRSASGQLLHGDLRAEHVYDLDDGIRILDGVAFDDDLASGDPTEDVAFLVMSLTCDFGRWDLEDALWDAAGITVEPGLRDLYVAHRALIRAKIDAIAGRPTAIRYLIHALARLEPVERRPAVVAFGGLPGVGKSTAAAQLGRFLGFGILRTDVVRKELPGPIAYDDAARAAIYDHTFRLARERLERGERVCIDASFGRDAWRQGLLQLAHDVGLRPLLLLCHAPASVARDRLARRRGDASDADEQVHALALSAWEPVSDGMQPWTRWLDTGGSTADTLAALVDALAEHGSAPEVLAPGLSQ